MPTYEQTTSGLLIPSSNVVTPSYRHDAWVNAESGQGIPGIDKTTATTYSGYGSILSPETLRALYRTDWLSRKICMKPAKDATRKFIQVKDAAKHKAIINRLKDIGARKKIRTALAWARLTGGSGIVMITNDDAMEPMIDGDVLVDIDVFDKWELTPVSYDMDYKSTNYMKPLIYQTYTGQRFHHTRVCKFIGAELTRDDERQNLFWGGSLIESTWSAIKNLQSTYGDVRFLLSELNVGILKIPDLTQINGQRGEGGAAAKVQKRVNTFNATKSNQRVAAIDAKEEFQFVSRTLAGVGELMTQFKNAAAAGSGLGELILFGESPSGLNASQEEQLSTYYDDIEDIRQDQVAPCIERLLSAMGYEETEWIFESLWEMSDKDKSLVMQQSAAAILPMINTLITPEEGIAQLNSLGVWDISDDIDDDAPNIMAEMEELAGNKPENQQGGEESLDPSQSLNGAQVTAMVALIDKIRSGEMKKETAVRVMTASFPMSIDQARSIVSEVIEGEAPNDEQN